MRVLYLFVTLGCIAHAKAQQYIYDNNKYDSLFKTGEYFEIIDTIFSNKSIYSYSIKYNFTTQFNGNKIYMASSDKIPTDLIDSISKYFSDTNVVKNDSISTKLLYDLNKQGIYFSLGSNLFFNSYFYNYKLPCSTTTKGLNNTVKSLESDNVELYQIHEVFCDRYLLVKWKKPLFTFGLRGIRFPVKMQDQLIMVEFPIGIEENYCNRQ